MQNNRYSLEFKEQALLKARNRGTRTLKTIARELNLPLTTLKGWLAQACAPQRAGLPHEADLPAGNLPAAQWSPAQRLLALHRTYALSDETLAAWCREHGLFEHQLTAWREEFCAPRSPSSDASKAALNKLQTTHAQLQKELTRKERALAEAAALLVLQKKFQTLLGGEAS
jgi:transposase-like protein